MSYTMIVNVLGFWMLIGTSVCFIYMAGTQQLEGGMRTKSWKEVIPNTYKRVGFIIMLGPIVMFFYALGTFFKWLRK